METIYPLVQKPVKGKTGKNNRIDDGGRKQQAWELKSSYMTYLINHKIFVGHEQEMY